MNWGPVEPRKQVAVTLCTVTVGGGQTAGSVQLRVNNPSSKLRCAIELGNSGVAAAIDPLGGTNWSAFAVANTNPPTVGARPVFSSLSIPDQFEFVSAGRIFDFFISLAFQRVTNAQNGQVSNFVALVTWEPIDPTMGNEERAYWFGLCRAQLAATSAGGVTPLFLTTA